MVASRRRAGNAITSRGHARQDLTRRTEWFCHDRLQKGNPSRSLERFAGPRRRAARDCAVRVLRRGTGWVNKGRGEPGKENTDSGRSKPEHDLTVLPGIRYARRGPENSSERQDSGLLPSGSQSEVSIQGLEQPAVPPWSPPSTREAEPCPVFH